MSSTPTSPSPSSTSSPSPPPLFILTPHSKRSANLGPFIRTCCAYSVSKLLTIGKDVRFYDGAKGSERYVRRGVIVDEGEVVGGNFGKTIGVDWWDLEEDDCEDDELPLKPLIIGILSTVSSSSTVDAYNPNGISVKINDRTVTSYPLQTLSSYLASNAIEVSKRGVALLIVSNYNRFVRFGDGTIDDSVEIMHPFVSAGVVDVTSVYFHLPVPPPPRPSSETAISSTVHELQYEPMKKTDLIPESILAITLNYYTSSLFLPKNTPLRSDSTFEQELQTLYKPNAVQGFKFERVVVNKGNVQLTKRGVERIKREREMSKTVYREGVGEVIEGVEGMFLGGEEDVDGGDY